MSTKNKLYYKIAVLMLINTFFLVNSCTAAAEVLNRRRYQSDCSKRHVSCSALAPLLNIDQLYLKKAILNRKSLPLIRQDNFDFVMANLEKDDVQPGSEPGISAYIFWLSPDKGVRVYSKRSSEPASGLYLRHVLCWILDSYFTKAKKYSMPRISPPLLTADNSYYMLFVEGKESIPVTISEHWGGGFRYEDAFIADQSMFTWNFRRAGIKIGFGMDMADVDDGHNIKNIINANTDEEIEEQGEVRLWKIIDFDSCNVLIDNKRLKNFIQENAGELKAVIGSGSFALLKKTADALLVADKHRQKKIRAFQEDYLEILLNWLAKAAHNPQRELQIRIVEKRQSELLTANDNIKVLILDLDDTLYSNEALKQAVLKQWHDFMILKIKKRLKISQRQAAVLLEKEKQKITAEFQNAYSRKPTFTEIAESIASDYDLSVKDWERFKDSRVKPEEYLSYDQRLINVLDFLAGKYTLVLVSNNTRFQAIQILYALGVKDYKKYFKIFKTSARKPSTHIFQYAAQQLSVLPEQCVSIGDSYEKDIKPALNLGMHGIHISSYKEFIEIADTVSLGKTAIPDAGFLKLNPVSTAARGLDPQIMRIWLEASS